MRFSASKEKSFYPDIFDNLNLPEAERLRVVIKLPTVYEREDLFRIETETKIKDAGKDDQAVKFRTVTNTKKILEDHVVKIENMVVDVDGVEKTITTGKELAQLRGGAEIGKLVDAICNEVAIKSEVSEEAQKN